MKELEICEIKPELVSDFKHPPWMWTEATQKSALKKAEAVVVKIKEETNQGAKSSQVVQKAANLNHPSSGHFRTLPLKPKFLSTL